MQRLQYTSAGCGPLLQVFCLHGGLSPTMDTLDHIRALDRVQEVSLGVPAMKRAAGVVASKCRSCCVCAADSAGGRPGQPAMAFCWPRCLKAQVLQCVQLKLQRSASAASNGLRSVLGFRALHLRTAEASGCNC